MFSTNDFDWHTVKWCLFLKNRRSRVSNTPKTRIKRSVTKTCLVTQTCADFCRDEGICDEVQSKTCAPI